jgi:hypothetical protein
MKTGWTLINGEARSGRHPHSFQMPPRLEREGLKPGRIVKIGIENPSFADRRMVNAERFWVLIEGICPADSIFAGHYYGRVENDLVLTDAHGIVCGARIVFRPEHILMTDPPPPGAMPPRASQAYRAMRQRLRAH